MEKETDSIPIILQDIYAAGETIISKIEKFGSIDSAIVLITGDDFVRGREARTTQARQNVILELGYFFGKIGRSNVALLKEKDVTLPSDLHGIDHIEMNGDDRWKEDIKKFLNRHAA